MTRAVIYTRPTYHITGDAQNKAILGTFACELGNVDFNIEKYMTMKSKPQIVRELEGIVHQRFNFQTLTKKLSDIFGVQVELYCSEDEMVELLGDYCYTFAIGDSFGVFDIYYLPHKQIDENGNDLYVTEAGYTFGC